MLVRKLRFPLRILRLIHKRIQMWGRKSCLLSQGPASSASSHTAGAETEKTRVLINKCMPRVREGGKEKLTFFLVIRNPRVGFLRRKSIYLIKGIVTPPIFLSRLEKVRLSEVIDRPSWIDCFGCPQAELGFWSFQLGAAEWPLQAQVLPPSFLRQGLTV